MLDYQYLLNIAIMIFGAVGGWLFKTIWAAQERMREDFSQLEKALPVTYVRKDDFAQHAERIEGTLLRIEDKLDRKVDKA